jgi:hypothetical protein
MYITVGPPCSGKTTLLKQKGIIDIALDDQPGVYMPLPTSYFLLDDDDGDNNLELIAKGKQPSKSKAIPTDTTVLGKSIKDRLKDQVELKCVLRRLSRACTQDEFYSEVSKCTGDNEEALALLFDAVEARIDLQNEGDAIVLPDTVDLFVQEAIFRGKPTGIERTLDLLQGHPLSQKVAYGNTNTRPRDYKSALEIAAQRGRPVVFLVYYAKPDNSVNSTAVDGKAVAAEGEDDAEKKTQPFDYSSFLDESIFDMHASLPSLMSRNLQRLLKTGRYIPVRVLCDMHKRTIESIERITRDWLKLREPDAESPNMELLRQFTQFDLHNGLAKMIHFELNEDRTVRPISQPPRHGKRPWSQDNAGDSRNQRRRYDNNQGFGQGGQGRGGHGNNQGGRGHQRTHHQHQSNLQGQDRGSSRSNSNNYSDNNRYDNSNYNSTRGSNSNSGNTEYNRRNNQRTTTNNNSTAYRPG